VIADVRVSLVGPHFAKDYASTTADTHDAFVEGVRPAREACYDFKTTAH